MLKRVMKRWASLALTTVMILSMLPVMTLSVAAANVSGFSVSGLTASCTVNSGDSATWDKDTGTLTLTATGTENCSFSGSTPASQKSTLTITNNAGAVGTLSFTASKTSGNGSYEVKKGGQSLSAPYSVQLNHNESVVIELTSEEIKNAKTTLQVSGIKLEVSSATVTFLPAENGGSYSVGGKAITAKTAIPTNGKLLDVATQPEDGMVFSGWWNGENGYSTVANGQMGFAEDVTLQPKFIRAEDAIFQVGEAYFSDLNIAGKAAAADIKYKVVVPTKDYTLPAGNYTIPVGVTLLVPFNKEHTVYTTSVDTGAYQTPTAFRTLTMADGVTLTVNGTLSVSSKICSAQNYNGAPTGPGGRIVMEGNSTISMENGSLLACYGFITGSGKVDARPGATVWECFQLPCFRGGNATMSMVMGSNLKGEKFDTKTKVFPLPQYYVQNIEVPLTVHAGAQEKVLSNAKDTEATFTFIGNDGLFRLGNGGSLTKTYNGTKDRVTFELSGSSAIESITLNVGTTVDSGNFILPINNNISIRLDPGANLSVNKSMALLPGADITVESGATLTVADQVKVYVYGKDNWGNYSGQNKAIVPVNYAVSKQLSRQTVSDAAINVEGTVQVDGELYTTYTKAEDGTIASQGINVTGGGNAKVVFNKDAGKDVVTYQATQSNTQMTPVEIPITPAQLKNLNPRPENAPYTDYTQTSGAAAGDKFVYSEGVWHKSAKDMDEETTEHWPHTVEEFGEAVPTTCTTSGKTAGSRCAVCGKVLVEREEIPALGHDYTVGENAWAWTKDEETGSYTVTLTLTCQREGCTEDAEEHSKTETATVGEPVVVKPTCVKEGNKTYTATVTVGEQTFTDTKVETIERDETAHVWDDGEVTEEATCTKKGVKTFTCTVEGCKGSKTEEIAVDPNAHAWDKGTESKEATCIQEGERTFTCTACKQTKTEKVPINPDRHNWQTGWSGDENSHWHMCIRCKKIKDVAEHTWDEGNVTQEVTCTTDGIKTIKCTVCNREKTEPIKASGHKYKFDSWGDWTLKDDGSYTIEAKLRCYYFDDTKTETASISVEEMPATCSKEGLKTYTASVTVDGKTETTEKTVTIDKVAHIHGKVVQENVKNATCTEAGSYEEVVYCSVCKEELSRESKSGEALGHSFTEYKSDGNATCTVDGTKTAKCDRCDATDTVTEKGSAKGHTEEIVPGKDPTCTETGLTAGSRCSVCKEVLKAQEVIPAKGHTHGEPKREHEVAATCTAPGSYEEVVYCAVCKAELSRTSKTIEKLSHSLEKTEAKAETCETAGNIAYWTCTVCKQIFSDEAGTNSITKKNTVIEALGHTEVIDAAVAPTCTEPGKTEGKHCSVCNKVLVKQETVKANGHTEVTIPGKAATCTETGLTDGTKCSVCGEIVKEQREIKALGHSYTSEITTAATCEGVGVKTYTCSRCDDTYTEDIPAIGHKYGEPAWGEWEESDDGYTIEVTFTCANCNGVQKPEVTVTSETVEATCTEDGETVYTAEVEFEGETYQKVKDGITISHEGHVYGEPEWEWNGHESAVATFTCTKCEADEQTVEGKAKEDKVPATCTKEGSVVYTVTVTFNERDFTVSTDPETIDATGHKEVTDEAVAATCEGTGLTEGSHCSVCGEVFAKQEVTPATGHDWDDGVVTIEPGCETTGVMTYTCKNDRKHTYTETVAETGHSLTDVEAKAPTCTEAGYSAYEVCEVCHEEFGKETVPAAGHKYGEPTFAWTQNGQGGWTAEAVFSCENCEHQRSVNAGVSVSSETSATCTASGLRVLTAKAEGFTDTKEVELPALGHTEVTDAAVAATCEGTGLTEGSHCAVCGEVLTPWETIPALGHNYEENWTWTADNQAKLALVCKRDATHVENLDTVVEVVETPATVSAPGSRVYTATVKLGDVEYTNSKTEIIPQLTPAPSGGGSGGGGSAKPKPPVEVVDPDVPLVEQPGGATVTVSEPVKDPETGEVTVEVEVKTDAPVSGGATVSIPVEGAEAGIVAVLVGEDGSETVIRKSVVTEGNVLNVPLEGSAVIRIRNNAKKFEDVPDTLWSAKAVAFVSSHELFNGTGEGMFSPTENMSRAMVATVLHNLENNPAARQAASFQDVASGKWYSNSIAWASENNVVSGYSGEAFGVNDNVTRQDLVVMLWRYAGRPDVEDGYRLDFTDAEDVSGYAETAMCWAVRNGIINGKGGGVLDPLGNATRQEVAQILQNFLENTAK